MPRSHARGPVPALVTCVLAAGGLLSVSSPVGAQEEPERPSGNIEARVRDLVYRSASLDGSAQDVQVGTERTVTLDADVLFEFDSDELDSEAESRLDSLAGDLDELGPRDVAISGHTDSTGTASYNQDLSERRAASVEAALADRLDSGFTFDITGHGQDEPVADNDTEEGQAQNRRVEIEFSTD